MLVVVDELLCIKCTRLSNLVSDFHWQEILIHGPTQGSCKDPFSIETCPNSTDYVCSFFNGNVSFGHLLNDRGTRTSLSITYIQSHTKSTTHGHTYTCILTHMCMHLHANSHPIVHVVHSDVICVHVDVTLSMLYTVM